MQYQYVAKDEIQSVQVYGSVTYCVGEYYGRYGIGHDGKPMQENYCYGVWITDIIETYSGDVEIYGADEHIKPFLVKRIKERFVISLNYVTREPVEDVEVIF